MQLIAGSLVDRKLIPDLQRGLHFTDRLEVDVNATNSEQRILSAP